MILPTKQRCFLKLSLWVLSTVSDFHMGFRDVGLDELLPPPTARSCSIQTSEHFLVEMLNERRSTSWKITVITTLTNADLYSQPRSPRSIAQPFYPGRKGSRSGSKGITGQEVRQSKVSSTKLIFTLDFPRDGRIGLTIQQTYHLSYRPDAIPLHEKTRGSKAEAFLKVSAISQWLCQ